MLNRRLWPRFGELSTSVLLPRPDQGNARHPALNHRLETDAGRGSAVRSQFQDSSRVRPEYGLIRPATFSYSPHHQKSDAAGNRSPDGGVGSSCDRIERNPAVELINAYSTRGNRGINLKKA